MSTAPKLRAPHPVLLLPHPVLLLPPWAEVVDLSGPPGAAGLPDHPYQIGRYDELRGIYTTPLFTAGPAPRCLHVGLDLGGHVGAAVHAYDDGEVILAGYNGADGDYGYTLVCAHATGVPLGEAPVEEGASTVAARTEAGLIHVLLGHLSAASLLRSPVGRRFRRGEVLGWLGDHDENGGWPPHVHVQLSRERPSVPDLPGAVALADREAALRLFPDPRLILGPIY